MRRDWTIAVLLSAITLALYWPVHGYDLVYYDDPLVLECSQVQAGVTWASLKWALTSVVIANWHPVTNLSFLVVSQFFGNSPGAHHLANALIHSANAALLFLLLRKLTGAAWRSAVVAAIFAWHPLRVESVAWIVERKDVLCAGFFFLALWGYARFVEEQKTGGRGIKRFYGASLLMFLLALLSKPMAVSLPFVLLLLDVWPFQRVTVGGGAANIRRAIIEKLPFFALTLGFCIATYLLQQQSAAMMSSEQLGYTPRLENAVSSYVTYLYQFIVPLNLAALYPYPEHFDSVSVILKIALLAAISAGCLVQLKQRPYLAVGWFWYLGTALPVIGLVQVGEQAMADRYTYLPLIGPTMALVWSMWELLSPYRAGKWLLSSSTILALSVLGILSARQIRFWHDSITLFSHSVAVAPDSGEAHFTLGLGYEKAGETNLAVVCYRVATALAPNNTLARRALGNVLSRENKFAAAAEEYGALLVYEPKDYSPHLALANALAAQGRIDDAITQFNEAVRLNPDSIEALNNLAWLLATTPESTLRDAPRAITLAQHACELTKHEKTVYLGTLGAAYAEAGQFDDAIATAQKACDLATKNGETNLLQNNQRLLALYQTHRAYHEK